MKKISLTKALALPLVLAATIATEPATAASWIKADGEINFDSTGKKSEDYEQNLRIQDAQLRFELLLREGIKLVVRTELEQKLNKDTMDEKFDVEKFLEQAYIQIETDKISGLPRAIITVGKHQIAFGQNYTEIPMFKDSLLYNMSREDEVIGMTVELPMNFFKVVDSVAISMFEAGAGDLKISDEKGASIKLSKKLSNQLEAQVSAMMKDQAGLTDKEKRGSVGFIFTSNDGNMKVWAEGIVTNKDANWDDNQYAGKVGASYKVGPGAVVVEYSAIKDESNELALAYNLPVGKNLVISPEVRKRTYTNDTDSNETVVGVRARLQFHAEYEHSLLTGRH